MDSLGLKIQFCGKNEVESLKNIAVNSEGVPKNNENLKGLCPETSS